MVQAKGQAQCLLEAHAALANIMKGISIQNPANKTDARDLICHCSIGGRRQSQHESLRTTFFSGTQRQPDMCTDPRPHLHFISLHGALKLITLLSPSTGEGEEGRKNQGLL